MILSKRISRNVRRLRRERRLTRHELGRLSGIDTSSVNRIEALKMPNMRIVTLEKLARGLRVTVADLVSPIRSNSR